MPQKTEDAAPFGFPPKRPGASDTEKDAADLLRLSRSWLAKARMRGDGPPFLKLGRCIRYGEGALLQWMKSRARLSTSER